MERAVFHPLYTLGTSMGSFYQLLARGSLVEKNDLKTFGAET